MPADPWWINASGGAPAYAADELRRLQSMLLTQGVADRFGARPGVHPAGTAAVTLSGTTVTVLDIKAVVYPGLTSQSGPYIVALPSGTHELDPADATNPRVDIVVLRVYDDDEDSSGLRQAVTEYIAGVPAASPVAPATPPGAVRLASAAVPQFGGGSPTLTYEAPYTVAVGGILPVRDGGELPTTGLYSGMYVDRLDLGDNGMLMRNRSGGSVWDAVGPAPVPVQVFSGTNILGFVDTSPVAGSPVCGVSFTAPPSGIVYVTIAASIQTNNSGTVELITQVRSGGTIGTGTLVYDASATDGEPRLNAFGVAAAGVSASARSCVVGLTPGDIYNAHTAHFVSSGGDGDIFRRHLMVEFHV